MKLIIKTWSLKNGKKEEVVPLNFTKQGYIRLEDQRWLLAVINSYKGRSVKMEVVKHKDEGWK